MAAGEPISWPINSNYQAAMVMAVWATSGFALHLVVKNSSQINMF